jgi:hypothetical protein
LRSTHSTGIPKDRKLFFNIAVRVELTHVSPQIFGLLLVLDAGKDHFGAGDLRLGIFYVLLECRFIPNDARALVGIRIIEIWHRAGRPAVKTIELGTDFVLRAGTDCVAG